MLGANGRDELGDGTKQSRKTPTNVIGLTSGVVTVALGDVHTCALTSASGVKCWGAYVIPGGDKTTPTDVVGLDVSFTKIVSIF